MRSTFLPFHVPLIDEEEIGAVVATLRSGWLTTGNRAQRFEADFQEFIGVRHAIAVNSCTAALHLALDALGVGEGDEVIVPTMTFAATASVVTHLRATPVLVDCQPDTLNIDPVAMERAITPRTKAVIPVHFAGHPCDMDCILAMAHRHDVAVVEDAAHALPAWYRGRMVGTLGDLTCFSFYATKTITTGEGGMITTASDEHGDRMRMMRLHGLSKDAWARYSGAGSWSYEILEAGYKYNLTDIAASLGIEQLKKCHRFWAERTRIATVYDAAFTDIPEIRTPTCRSEVEHAWHIYAIQLDLDRLSMTRREFIEALKAENIGTSVHFIPLHLHPYYRRMFGYRAEQFPESSAIAERIVSLPLYPGMTDADVDDVIEAVTATVKRSRRRARIDVVTASRVPAPIASP
jgi:dTDP-4-amino-4,6-dideoxygalactose transaminase